MTRFFNSLNKLYPFLAIALFAAAILLVLLPLIGNLFYQQAYANFQQENWDAAIKDLLAASRWEPANTKYIHMRADALINKGNYQEALQAYLQVLKARKEYPPDLSKLGWLYWLQNDINQAQGYFQRAVASDPMEAYHTGSHAELGLAYVAQKRLDEAIPLFKKSIELHPEVVTAPYWLPKQLPAGYFDLVLDPAYEVGAGELSPLFTTRILINLGKADYTQRLIPRDPGQQTIISLSSILDMIESDYQGKAANLDTDAPEMLIGLVRASALAGFRERAERLYHLYIETYPRSTLGYQGLGALYLEENRLDEAGIIFGRAVSAEAVDDWIWRGASQVAMAQQKWSAARQALDEAILLKPFAFRNYDILADLARSQRKLPEEIEALQKAALLKGSGEYQEQLAEVYYQNGQIGLSVDACKKFTQELFRKWVRPYDTLLVKAGQCLSRSSESELNPTLDEFIQNRPLTGYILAGHVYRALGQEPQAITAYQSAIQADSTAAAPHYFLGESYAAQGDIARATDEYRHAFDLYPVEPLPLLSLGRLTWANNQKEISLEVFRQAVEIAPGWDEAQYMLANALLALGNRADASEHIRLAQLAVGLHEGEYFRFIEHLADANIQTTNPEYVKLDQFTVNGTTQRVLFLHPDSNISYSLQLPESEKLSLQFMVSLAPDSWSMAGDGVEFVVRLFSAGGEEQVFDTYLDPKNREADRRWVEGNVDLRAKAGQLVQFKFETRGGPANDIRFDWAGWGEPLLVIEK